MRNRIWESVSETLFITREQFDRSLDGWELDPFENENGLYGVVLKNGPQFHFMTFGPKWTLNKEILAKYPGSLIEQYGYAETFTPIEDVRQHRFNKRLGFVETKRDDTYVFFRIDRMKI